MASAASDLVATATRRATVPAPATAAPASRAPRAREQTVIQIRTSARGPTAASVRDATAPAGIAIARSRARASAASVWSATSAKVVIATT
eukprot:3021034-Rhodomonas_salina.1